MKLYSAHCIGPYDDIEGPQKAPLTDCLNWARDVLDVDSVRIEFRGENLLLETAALAVHIELETAE